jgi:putative CocE/NonD family hydrolase
MRTLSLPLLAVVVLSAPPALSHEAAGKPEVEMLWAVKVPMRDGVSLNATVFKPKGQPGRWPVVFTLTPYNSDTYYPRAQYFARNGYVFALVDVRGRGNSGGAFMPFENEGRDGHDVVEWLAAQRWSTGKVGMWGGSYAGFDQWVTLKEFPPHLATIVPAAAAAAAVDFPFRNGIATPYLVQWRTYTSGVTPQPNLFNDQSFWIAKFRELYLSHRPFREFDEIAGNPSDWFQKLLQHPTPDEYWKAMRLTPAEYGRIAIPILTITGHYDDDQLGALHYYRMHMAHGSAEAKARHYLLVGPWDHAGTRTPNRDVGGLSFGPASMLDLNALHKAWYDWTLKDGSPPQFLESRVTYYVVPADRWKYADSIEAIVASTRTLYLSSDGNANDLFRAGRLASDKPKSSRPDGYAYDPLDTRPAALEREEIKNYLTDQRYLANTFGNGVIYHSEPLTEDVELTGFVRLSVWMSLDVPDTDFKVSLYEVLADGSSVLLAEDQKRARYRESLEKQVLVQPAAILRYGFDSFPFFSRRLAKGSRLRLFLRCPNTIFLQKNYNGGGVVADETAKNARVAHVVVHHDAEHPSALELPIARAAPRDAVRRREASSAR